MGAIKTLLILILFMIPFNVIAQEPEEECTVEQLNYLGSYIAYKYQEALGLDTYVEARINATIESEFEIKCGAEVVGWHWHSRVYVIVYNFEGQQNVFAYNHADYSEQTNK